MKFKWKALFVIREFRNSLFWLLFWFALWLLLPLADSLAGEKSISLSRSTGSVPLASSFRSLSDRVVLFSKQLEVFALWEPLALISNRLSAKSSSISSLRAWSWWSWLDFIFCMPLWYFDNSCLPGCRELLGNSPILSNKSSWSEIWRCYCSSAMSSVLFFWFKDDWIILSEFLASFLNSISCRFSCVYWCVELCSSRRSPCLSFWFSTLVCTFCFKIPCFGIDWPRSCSAPLSTFDSCLCFWDFCWDLVGLVKLAVSDFCVDEIIDFEKRLLSSPVCWLVLLSSDDCVSRFSSWSPPIPPMRSLSMSPANWSKMSWTDYLLNSTYELKHSFVSFKSWSRASTNSAWFLGRTLFIFYYLVYWLF